MRLVTCRLFANFRMRAEKIVPETSSDSDGKHDEAVIGHEE